jgi:hypothetical protein
MPVDVLIGLKLTTILAAGVRRVQRFGFDAEPRILRGTEIWTGGWQLAGCVRFMCEPRTHHFISLTVLPIQLGVP